MHPMRGVNIQPVEDFDSLKIEMTTAGIYDVIVKPRHCRIAVSIYISTQNRILAGKFYELGDRFGT